MIPSAATSWKCKFILPDLGPIGATYLANPRDFVHPTACHDVLALQRRGVAGNYVPCKYNLDHFCTMNTVNYDHPDPSIYTVLTCQTDYQAAPSLTSSHFPAPMDGPRENFPSSLLPSQPHDRILSMIYGHYDAKTDDGFVPGKASYTAATRLEN
ncbi:homogentisate 1,2-dioxygenase [Aphanomyces invadans]|uniref:homogentisate 1,2-dioxygenase n=1 Tax=Aphanomyces invadans TaxID=157072 RepID=A0A024UJU4_9STRA|nr:homogentisate 1,2-dioxygenase [Aphanomyces invadans]ETW06574.1 homogentisate 1,2-dioxygenase [Aphanomyces invadans]|eukprot:XP_008864649.1 homogentisate 1,2-dioxygenase [Aphanomyces invadans]